MPPLAILSRAFCTLGVMLTLLAACAASAQSAPAPTDVQAANTIDRERMRAFEALLLPSIEKINAQIRADRSKVLATRRLVLSRLTLTRSQRGQYRRIANRYREPGNVAPQLEAVDALLKKVAEVSAERLIDQAANASDWGEAARARQTFNYYGLLCRRGICELQPDIGPRTPLSRFSSVLESTRSYARMLNTQPEYADFREQRAASSPAARSANRTP